LLCGISGSGFILAAATLTRHGLLGHGGSGGVDVFAYWDAGRHVLDGSHLYGGSVGGRAAYLYPPVFAQLLALPAMLPFVAFAWLWRGLELLCLRGVIGSWQGTGVALLLFPPAITELDAGNVHLIVALALAALLRGNPRAIAPVGLLTKFAPLAAMPLAFAANWRATVRSLLAVAAVCFVSLAIHPRDWIDYARLLVTVQEPPQSPFVLLGGIPLIVRDAAACALGLLALRWRLLVVPAVVLAYPVLWLNSLSTLVAIAYHRD
jgi:hypothetical protein